MAPQLVTVGHSNHPLGAFLTLLQTHGVGLVADVRSSPYSRYCPEYNRHPLAAALTAAGVRYEFLGRELGARRDEPECYVGGVARYERVAELAAFRDGLARVRGLAAGGRVALVCAEQDPLDCHRFALVCRSLADVEPIAHIRADGTLEGQAAAEDRLLARCGLAAAELFRTRAERLAAAYDILAARLAYVAPEADPEAMPGWV